MEDDRIKINVHKDILVPIGTFDRFYEEAKGNKFVKKPISWALYKTWQAMDEKEKPREGWHGRVDQR